MKNLIISDSQEFINSTDLIKMADDFNLEITKYERSGNKVTIHYKSNEQKLNSAITDTLRNMHYITVLHITSTGMLKKIDGGGMKYQYVFYVKQNVLNTTPTNTQLLMLKEMFGNKDSIVKFLCEQMCKFSDHLHHMKYDEKKKLNPIKKNFIKWLYNNGYTTSTNIIVNNINNDKFNQTKGHELVEFEFNVANTEFSWHYPLERCDFLPSHTDVVKATYNGMKINAELKVYDIPKIDKEFKPKDEYPIDLSYTEYINVLQRINDNTQWEIAEL